MRPHGLPFRDDYLGYRDTLAVRFLLLIGIFLFHGGYEYGYEFPNVGYTCVAGFFFLSGFGLEYSVRNKQGYLRSFLQKRVFGILIQFWIIQAIAAVVILILYLDPAMSYDRIVTALLRHPIWFITELIVFYVVFFFASMIRDDRRRLLAILIVTSVLMLLMTDYYGSNLYLKSGMAFVLGVAWCVYRERIDSFLWRHYLPMMVVSIIVLALTYRFFSDVGDLVACGVTCVFSMVILCMACMVDARRAWYVPFALVVIGAVLCVLRIDSGVSEGSFMILFAGVASVCYCIPSLQDKLAFWGNMSFEFFIMHFLPLEGLYPDFISNVPVAFVVSFVLSMVLTYIAWRAVRFVMSRYNDGLKRLGAV